MALLYSYLAVMPLLVVSCDGSIEDVNNLLGVSDGGTSLSWTMDTDDFGSVVSSTESSQKDVTVTNNGETPLRLVSISTLPDTSVFSVTENSCTAGLEMPLQGACSIKVTFAPTSNATLTDSLDLVYEELLTGDRTVDEGDRRTLTILLSGRGVPADDSSSDLTIAGSSAAFSGLVDNFESASTTVTVTNNTKNALYLRAVAVDTSDHFTLSDNICPSGEVALGSEASCTMKVTFTPKANGTFQYKLSIAYGPTVGNSAYTAKRTLSGSSVAAASIGNSAISYSPAGDTYNYGSVSVSGGGSSKTFTLTNISRLPLYISTIAETGTSYTITSNTCPLAPTSLATGVSCAVTVKFLPIAGGVQPTSLKTTYGVVDGSYIFSSSVELTGTGVANLSFSGISSISSVTTTTATINWTHVSDAVVYYVYRVNAGVPTQIAIVAAPTATYSLTGLTPSTAYTYRVRAANSLYIAESNTNDVSITTDAGGSFGAIAGFSVAEAATGSSATLSCTDGSNTPSYAVTSQTDTTANCSISANRLQCTPSYATGHSSRTSTVVVTCTLNGSTYTQSAAVTITDTNRAPSLDALTAQSVTALQSIASADANDSTGGNSDSDGDTLTFSCTIVGDASSAFTTATNCGTGTAPTIVSSTGVVSWTTVVAHATSTTEIYTITVTASDQQGTPLTGTTTLTVTITPAIPLLTTVTDKVFASNEVGVGNALNIDLNDTRIGGDTGVTYSCKVTTVGVTNQDCATASLGSINTSTGVFTWTTTTSHLGTYAFTITGTNSVGSDTESFNVNIKPAIYETNLGLHLDPFFGNLSSFPSTTNQTTWYDLLGSNNGTISGTGATFWAGSGTFGSPYYVDMPGTDQRVDFGSTVLSSATGFMSSMWFNPDTVATDNSILMSSGGGSGNGMVLRQSPLFDGRLEMAIGNVLTPSSYHAIILEQKPIIHWKMNESSGNLADSSPAGANYPGVVGGTPTYSQTGALSGSSDTAIDLNTGTNQYFYVADNDTFTFSTSDTKDKPFSFSMWYKPDTVGAKNVFTKIQEYGLAEHSGSSRMRFFLTDKSTGVSHYIYNTTSFVANTWYHIAITYDGRGGAAAGNGVKFYVNGVDDTGTRTNNPSYVAMENFTNEIRLGYYANSPDAKIDEFALFDYTLSYVDVLEQYEAGAGTGKVYPNEYYRAKPKAYLRFNEADTTSQVLHDSSGNGNHVTAHAAVAKASSHTTTMGNALDATAGGFWGNFPPGTSLNGQDGTNVRAFSFATWFKAGDSSIGRHFIKNGSFELKLLSSGVIRLTMYATGTDPKWESTSTYENNTWHHLVVTVSSDGTVNGPSKIKGYIDGVATGSVTDPGDYAGLTLTSAESITVFGSSSASSVSQSWTDYLDEYAFFDHELSAARVARMYAETKDKFCLSETLNVNGQWDHVGTIWENTGKTLGLYINGNKECSTTTTGTFTPAANLTLGGSTTGTNPFNGQFGNTEIYTRTDATAPGAQANLATNISATKSRYYTTMSTNTKSTHFDGVDDKLSIANNAALRPTTMTLSAWVNRDTYNTGDLIMSMFSGSNNKAYEFYINNSDRLIFANSDTGSSVATCTGVTAINSSVWHHVAVTLDSASSTAILYIDGRRDITCTSMKSSVFASTAALVIGGNVDGTKPFDGYIDEVALFNTVATPAQIYKLFNGGAPGNINDSSLSSSLVGWWPMGDIGTYPTVTGRNGAHSGTFVNTSSGVIESVVP